MLILAASVLFMLCILWSRVTALEHRVQALAARLAAPVAERKPPTPAPTSAPPREKVATVPLEVINDPPAPERRRLVQSLKLKSARGTSNWERRVGMGYLAWVGALMCLVSG
ncbi:MAG: hypothetical protein KDB53_00055, partial [Planctomycetes bacterium]|nr:hypothetical protein [Planctomycetota bacterium]